MKTNEALISDRDDKIFVLIMYLTVPIQALKKSFRYEEVALLHKLLISSIYRYSFHHFNRLLCKPNRLA